MTGLLPAEWTVERLRAVSGDDTAVLVDPVMVVTADSTVHDAMRLQPELVIAFHDLCIVKCVDDGDWFMGSILDDGSILCWAAYSDLEQAVRGL